MSGQGFRPAIVAWHSCQTCAVPDPQHRLLDARLYLVCPNRPESFLRAALQGGVDMVQLRMKDASDEEILAAAHMFAALCAEHEALFVLNDRPDLVEACGAHGVHVGQRDTAVADARAALGPDRIVGLSIETVAQLDEIEGADYLGVGAVFATPTKTDATAAGLDLVRAASERVQIPWFAIGGIDLGNAGEVIAAGAPGIAVVRAIRDADDAEAAARGFTHLFG